MPYTADHVRALAAEGVTAVVNLCEEGEYWDGELAAVRAAYADAGVAEHHLPVPDGASVPSRVLDAAVALARDGTVYVHCRGGRERSAAVAVAVLVEADGLAVSDALARVRESRPICAPLPWQIDAVRAWARARESP